MADGADHGSSGVRRRHSQYDDGDMIAQSQVTSPTAYTINTTSGRPTGSALAMTSSKSSAVDSADVPASASEPAPRVRFSTDVERPRQSRTSGSGPHRMGAATYNVTADRRGSTSRKRPGTPVLLVDTQKASSAGQTVLGEGTMLSPSNLTSPTSPQGALRTSPLSPSGRNRGYSLRSSLFRRNITDQAGVPGDVIELQDTPSSSTDAIHTRPETAHSKKSSTGDAMITILPTTSEEYIEPPDTSIKASKEGLKGISALPNYESWIRERARHNVFLQRIKDGYGRARKFILRISEIPPSKDGRQIDLDASRKKSLTDERTGKHYIGNTIRSSRYTAWNFLPRQLFAQFSKLANFYFLCVSILQMIPNLSTTGTYTTIIPLLFFVSISMAKEGYDDFRRYRLDKAENNRDATILHAYQPTDAAAPKEESTSPSLGPLHWAVTKWKDIRVGDVVKLERNDPAPADLVLLHSSGANGIAYVETMALDGETNLKSKQTTASLARLCKTTESIASCRAHFVVEDPNLDLYNFEGRVTVDGETSPLTNAEIIYRGSVLRNTPDAIGMVIYTGEECKIRMNANKNPRIKAPALQSIVNRIVIFIVLFVVALAIFNTVAYQIWSQSYEEKAWYLTNAGVAFFPILASFIIMFNTMIPLSLYVSLEIVKLAQMFLLNDIDMYDPVSDTPFEARTSTINEELGQISYIFSDKTGTLTDNSMKFRKISVAGTAWLHDLDLKNEDQKQRLLHKKRNKGKKPLRRSRASTSTALKDGLAVQEEELRESQDVGGIGRSNSKWRSSARPAKSQPLLGTLDMIKYIQRKPYTVFARKARIFLLSLALCHTCLPEEQDDGHIDFQASSPDELALVRAAQELGFLVINRDVNTITLKLMLSGPDGAAVEEIYEVLDVIEFSSKRKRMSIVVRFPDNRICLFCKGADSVVMQRLKMADLANSKMVEIEKRASKRKSLEAQFAMQRKSEQIERQNSIARTSISLSRVSGTFGRPSIGAVGRLSMQSGKKLQPIRDELDQWLKERERDVEVSSVEDNSIYYSPRPSIATPRQSTQTTRHSMAASEARSSMQLEETEDLVDESLVVDEPIVIERCFQHINDFATEGLRTLLYGFRFLDEQEYQAWKKVYLDATTSLVDRQNMIERAGELIEQNLELAGATAIEDKLQMGVPEAIDKLRRANIKMWMLTGDKRETAINIGHSCRLIKDYSTVYILDHETGEVEQSIAAAILAINAGKVAHSVVVVDGQTLAMINDDKTLEALFFDVAILADSVICCRASPSQKAGLVKAIRKRVKKSITLAIGDGANDIAMIQEAHVGIGITGKEGLQAARTSDYSIAQFRFLTKLLIVHGRWNYIRTCKYTVGTFWKEMLFYLTQAVYQRWAGYTGTSLYESWSLSMFNTLFTSLPVIFMGIFEKDLAASTLLAVPELYTKGQRNGAFNFTIYLGWMFMAASEAMMIYFTMYGLYGRATLAYDNGLFALGDLTFTACILLINLKMQAFEMHNKSIMAVVALFCSIGGWFLWNVILATTYSNNIIYNVKDGLFDRFGKNALWWLTLILILASVVVFELGVSSLRAAFWTSDVDVFQELEKDPMIKRRLEEAASMELQQGWDRDNGKTSSFEIMREEEEQRVREGEVQDLLMNRPDKLEDGRRPSALRSPRHSLEIQEMLTRGFGSIKK